MTTARQSASSQVRAGIGHPVVDADGHIMEYMPLVQEYVRDECARQGVNGTVADAGSLSKLLALETFSSSRLNGAQTAAAADAVAGGGVGGPGAPDWYEASAQERRDWRLTRPVFWVFPTKITLDAATSRLPRLLRERFDELGLDFAVLYPTFGLVFPRLPDDEQRRIACRAFNRYLWDLYGGFSDVMTPAAVIPAHTPEEAVSELEFAVRTLGFKVVLLPSHVRRPLRAVDAPPGLAPYATYVDKLALDSEYDYDPVWRKCVELKVSPTFHTGSQEWDSRNSPSNYMYNHIGHFAADAEALCKALFLGGVTRRFPELAFAFLEGGVGWAVNLYSDLVGHWEKRSGQTIGNNDPRNLDQQGFLELVRRYGDDRLLAKVEELGGRGFFGADREDRATIDEFREARVEQAEHIKDRFVPNFFFGCEADDPLNAHAFNTKVNPFNARLNAVFGSDIGHWDVPDVRHVLDEAYELVEHELMSEADFRDFVFTNPVSLHTRLNKEFFKGTAVESAVAAVLAEQAAGAR